MGRIKPTVPIGLIDLALAYRVRPFLDQADDPAASSTAFSISRCSLDVLLMIFQELVDEEAASYRLKPYVNSIKPRIAPLLALVSKHWKDIVYSTPRLWAVVAIDVDAYLADLSLSTQQLQTRHYIQQSKRAPVDLYLFNYSISRNEREQDISSILNVIPNIRKLHVGFITTDKVGMVTPLLLSRAWPALRNVRELSYSVSGYPHLLSADLASHLMGIPRLNSLWIGESWITLPPRNNGSPLLPALTSMFLEKPPVGVFDEATRLALFLSHAPRIEELDVAVQPWTMREILGSPTPAFSLTHLRVVNSRGSMVLGPFLSHEISTPHVKTFTLTNWIFSLSTTKPLAIASWFTRISNTLTTLTIEVRDQIQLEHLFAPLIHLHTLSLIASDGEGQYLAPLYNPIAPTAQGNNGAGVMHLPSLRFLVLSLCRALTVEHFEKLVTARCMPINAQRTTAMGYPVLENFVIITLSPPNSLQYVVQTPAWDAAAMRVSRGVVFELQWEFWETGEVRTPSKKRRSKRKAPTAPKTRKQETGSSARMVTTRVKEKGRYV